MTDEKEALVGLKKAVILYLRLVGLCLLTGAIFGSFFYFGTSSPNKLRTAILIGLFPVVFTTALISRTLMLDWKIWRATKQKKTK